MAQHNVLAIATSPLAYREHAESCYGVGLGGEIEG